MSRSHRPHGLPCTPRAAFSGMNYLNPATPLVNVLAFPRPPRTHQRREYLQSQPNLLWLTTDASSSVGALKCPALYFKRPRASRRGGRFLVLYSHGNAEDLSELPRLIELYSSRLDADVLAYEYPGYSIADGSNPNEAGLYAVAAAAYAWAVKPEAENLVAGSGGRL